MTHILIAKYVALTVGIFLFFLSWKPVQEFFKWYGYGDGVGAGMFFYWLVLSCAAFVTLHHFIKRDKP